jgi:hypothetical protein
MLPNIWYYIFDVGIFIFLLFISWKITCHRDKFHNKVGLVTVSFFQGFLLAFLFFSYDITLQFSTMIVIGMMYYMFFTKILMLLDFFKNKSTENFEKIFNNEIAEYLAKIWSISDDEISLTKFFGKNSWYAYTKMDYKKIDIYFGEVFEKMTTREEKIFTYSHEIAHTKIPQYLLYSVGYPVIYLFFCIFFFFILGLFRAENAIILIVFSIFFYIIGIMGLNFIYWLNEFKADEMGLRKSKNLSAAITLLEKLSVYQDDHGWLLDLIFYDHPSCKIRIRKLKKCNEVNIRPPSSLL